MTLDEFLSQRDALLLSQYTPGMDVPSEQSAIQWSQPSTKSVQTNSFSFSQYDDRPSREEATTYTANLLAASVYGGAPYAGNPPSRRRQGRGNRSRIASSNESRMATSPIFLATSLNKQICEEKRSHERETEHLKEALVRQKRDIQLLKTQLKQRNCMLEEIQQEMVSLKEQSEGRAASLNPTDSAHIKTATPLELGPLSGSERNRRLYALAEPLRRREKVIKHTSLL